MCENRNISSKIIFAIPQSLRDSSLQAREPVRNGNNRKENTMKKIISLVMVLGIILSNLTFYTFAEEAVTVDEEVYGLLSAIGILSETDIENADKPVSRGEFIKYLTGAYGLNQYLSDEITASHFYDVDITHPYAKEINTAYNAKLTNGYADGSFRPDEPLSANDMITFVVTMLGYSYQADASGGYPSGYSVVANGLGLYKGVNITGATVLKADALRIIFNALNTNIMTKEYVTAGGDSVKLKEGDTLLSSMFQVGKVDGIMEANDLTWLKAGGDVRPFRVIIGGKTFESGHSGAENYLGYNVTAYYKYDGYIDENTIIYITKTKDKNEEIIIDIKDIAGIRSGVITYSDEDMNIDTLKFDTGAAIIYNGTATSSAFNDSIIPAGYNGTVKLLSNNGGNYNVIFIDCYKDYFVTEVNYKDYIIYENKQPKTLDPEKDDPFVEIYNEKGEPCDFSEIQRYSVVSVYESKSDAKQKYAKVYISNGKLRGKVSEIHTEDGIKTLKIGNEYYSFTDEYVAKNLNTLIIGRSYEFALNHKGNIYGVRALSSDGSLWGYIVTGRVTGNPATEQAVKVKLYTQLGEFSEYEFNERIIIDGIPYKDKPNEAWDWIKKASYATFAVDNCYAQLVRFETNDMSKITKIDTVLSDLPAGVKSTRYDVDTDNMIFNTDLDKIYYTSGERTFSGKALVSSSADVFNVVYPEKDDSSYLNEDNYSIATVSSMGTGYRTAKAYYEGNTSIQASALVVEVSGDAGETSNDRFSMVKKITESVDKEGTPCYTIYAYKDGAEVKLQAPKELTYKDESDPDGEGNPKEKSIGLLDPGDIFMYTLNSKTGIVKSIRLYYYSDKKLMTTVNSVNSSFTATRRFIEGTVYEKFDDGFALALTTDLANIATADMEYYIKPTCPIVVYDSYTKRVSGGSFNEMESYLLSTAKASRILMHINQVYPRAIFIIK